MTTQTILRPSLGPIEPSILYPLEDLKARSGMGSTAMRSARAAGLRVSYVSGRGYVLGKDFIDFVQANGKPTK